VHVNGQHSLVAIAGFAVVIVIRLLASPRRRGTGGQRGHSGASGFTASPAPSQTPSSSNPSSGSAFTGTAPGWFTDPFVRHEQRYWSGETWTEHVLDGGTPAIDPPPPPQIPR
jgi:hypothetical protein